MHNKPPKIMVWMRKTADDITAINPDLSGRLDWDTLKYMYREGKTPEEAIKAYLHTETDPDAGMGDEGVR